VNWVKKVVSQYSKSCLYLLGVADTTSGDDASGRGIFNMFLIRYEIKIMEEKILLVDGAAILSGKEDCRGYLFTIFVDYCQFFVANCLGPGNGWYILA
jgi:hypothetical protein